MNVSPASSGLQRLFEFGNHPSKAASAPSPMMESFADSPAEDAVYVHLSGKEPSRPRCGAALVSQEAHCEGEEKEGESTLAAGSGRPTGADGKPLSDEQEHHLKELKRRDQQVRAHEQAHMSAGAGVVQGGAQYQYEKGPDGVLYAVGGEVSVDTSEGRTPQETVRKMERVKAAAMAPSDPSPQDRRVAAQAAAKAAAAKAEITQNSQAGGEAGVRNTNDRTEPSRSVSDPSGVAQATGILIDIAA